MFKNKRTKQWIGAGIAAFSAICVMIITACSGSLDPDLESLRNEIIDSTRKTYTVTFVDGVDVTNGDIPADPSSIQVTTPATKVETMPSEPARDGYTFEGWNTAEDGTGTEFNASTPVTGNITVYAQWVAVPDGEYTVIFIDGDKPLVTQVVAAGEKATDPNSSKDGYVIEGWYKEVSFENKWDFDVDTVGDNIRLYAKWLIDYEVVADGETDITSTTKLTITFGEAVSGLDVGDITLTDDTGEAIKGTLTGSGTTWTLTVTDVVQGDITFAITKDGINPDTKTVAVYVASDDVTFMLTAVGTSETGTTAITITLSEAVPGLDKDENLMIGATGDTGAIVSGDLTSIDNIVYTLEVTSVTTAGTVTIAITKEGITTEGKTVTVSKASPLPADVGFVLTKTDNAGTTTELVITLDSAVAGLTKGDITLGGTADIDTAATFTTDDSIIYKLALTAIRTTGTVTVTIGKTGIVNTESDPVDIIAALASIAVTDGPTKNTYTAGEMLDLDGLEITATYSNKPTAVVLHTSTTPDTSTPLATSDTTVTVTYTEGIVTRTTTFNITINPSP